MTPRVKSRQPLSIKITILIILNIFENIENID
jgi:hypothetical protein